MATILMVTRPILPPWNEGSKNTAWQIAQRAKRHQFHLMTIQVVNHLPPSDSVTWRHIYTDKNFVLRQKTRLLWHLVSDNSDIDICHFLFVPTLLSSRLLSGIVRFRERHSIQTVPGLYQSNLTKANAHNLLFADKVVAISDWTANRLEMLGVKNVVRINAGIDLCRFKAVPNKEALQKKFGLPSKTPLVLFSGELSRLGSVELLLKIIRHVLVNDIAVHFVIACPTRLPEDIVVRQKLQQTICELNINNSVQILGDVDDFPGLLNACDLMIFPVSQMVAKIDTPLTILEGMAVGLPVIITDIPPLNEILKADAGIAVPLDDVDGFAQAIVELASDENRRYQMGDAGQKVTNVHYNLQTMVQAYECLYDKLI